MLSKVLLILAAFLYGDPIGMFLPPEGWECVQSKDFPTTVQIGFLKQGQGIGRPSLNLTQAKVSGSWKEYLQAIRKLHEQELKMEWRDLGDFCCRAGKGRLIEIRSGEMKMLQAIVLQDGWAYVLTGAAQQDTFAGERRVFLRALRSLWVLPDLFAAIADQQKRSSLQQVLNMSEDPHLAWKNYRKMLSDYQDLGAYWLFLALKEGRSRLFSK
jgi:hypothetical protein